MWRTKTLKHPIQKIRKQILSFGTTIVLVMATLSGAVPLFLMRTASAAPVTDTVCSVQPCDAATVQAAINSASPGDIISFAGNATFNQEVTISQPLTIDGNGYTVDPTFFKTSNSNNAIFGVDGTSNVTFNDMVVDGSGGVNLHGINVYESTDVQLNNSTIKNNNFDGLVVNGSTVTVNNITTANNGWGGIDVDQGTGVTSAAILTVNGTSNQSEIAAIFVDDINKDVMVNDTNAQYVAHPYQTISRYYTQRPTGLANLSPASGTYTTTAAFTQITWQPASSPFGPLTYYYESSLSNAQNNDGSFSNPIYTSSPLNTAFIPTSGTSAGVYYWHVRAVDALGDSSAWTSPWKVTVDNTPPTTPTGGLPNNSTEFTNYFNFTWNASTDIYPLPITYQFQSSLNPANSNGVLTTNVWHSGTLPTPLILSQGAPDGVWYWQVRAIDSIGNMSPWSAIWQVRLDNATLPAPTLIAPINDAYVNGATSLTNSWSAVPGAVKYEYQSFNDPAGTSLRFDGIYTTTSKTATNVADGTVFYWRVRAIDQYGKPGAWSNGGNLWKVTVDNVAPVVAITAPTSGAIVKGSVPITGTITDVNPDHYYLVILDSKGNVVAGPGVVYSPATNVSYVWDTTKLVDGTYTIDFEARDKAGNKDANSVQTINVTVDNTAPVITDSSFNIAMLTGDKVTLDPSVTDVSAITYKWQVSGNANSNLLLSNPLDTLNGTSLNIGPAPKGNYTVTLTATDQAGNSSTATYTVTISDHGVNHSNNH